MKKGLLFLTVVLTIVMSVSMIAPAFAASDMDCVIFSPQAPNVGIGWIEQNGHNTGLFVGYSAVASFDEETGAVKFEGTGSNMYLQVWSVEDDTYKVVASEYPYMAFSYKILGCEDTCEIHIEEGTVKDDFVGEVTEFTKKVGPTPMSGIDKLGLKVSIKVVDYYTQTVNGVTAYLQYVGFFKSEADAKAFDYTEWVKDIPEYIPPQPDVSKPEPEVNVFPPYHIDNKYPAVTGHVTMVSGAVILFAAAAAAVVVFGKNK